MPHQLYKSSYYYPPLYPLNYSTTQVLPQGKNSIVTKAHNHSYRYLREAAHHHLFLHNIHRCNLFLHWQDPTPMRHSYTPPIHIPSCAIPRPGALLSCIVSMHQPGQPYPCALPQTSVPSSCFIFHHQESCLVRPASLPIL